MALSLSAPPKHYEVVPSAFHFYHIGASVMALWQLEGGRACLFVCFSSGAGTGAFYGHAPPRPVHCRTLLCLHSLIITSPSLHTGRLPL